MTTKTKWFLAALALSFPLDQITKYAILAHFYYGERLVVIPGVFDLTYVRNPGGAFSFFATGAYEWRMLFFVGSTVVSVILLLVFLSRHEPESRLSPMALGLIMGGALGNLLDRLIHGEVIDFLDIHLWSGYTWPTFNIADSTIVVGVGLMILEVFLFDSGPSKTEAQKDPAQHS
ncbi:MAG: signal peptidase II [bacterium TMED88]|nr:signal peptidase II [Deltaproteobacteria bacterium]OUV37324.1 MAG: signal peptidase II [bacterium TMED88]